MTELVRGSLQDIANNNRQSVAQTFLGADAIVLIDVSYSMDERDCPGSKRRFDVAQDQLICLQKDLPGKIAVIAWHSQAYFCPGGLPDAPIGGTDLTNALKFVQPADGCGIKLIVISDGEPDNETTALDLAGKFKTPIQTIFVGPETSPGRDFLRRLAEASGGQAVSQSVRELPQLSKSIQGLLTTGA